MPAPWQDILDLAYYSGWRKNEILGLTWDEIDEAGGVIRLSPARSKTLVGRILPISQPIADALDRWRAQRDPDSPLGIVNLASCWQSYRMPSYRGYRFSPEIISHAVWLYHRFALSFRDVEDVLAGRGVEVTYEAIRKWCRRFGPEYAGRLRRRRGRLGDTWYLDEVFVTIQGRQQYL